jgi:phage gpG-like protein
MAAVEMTFAELADRLGRLAADLASPRWDRSLEACLIAAKADVKENFARGTAPDGTTWAPLERPRQGKRHRNSSPLPLRDTGLLMASVTAVGPGHIEDVQQDGVTLGTSLDYAGIHQDGGTVHIPARRRTKGQKPYAWTTAGGGTAFARAIRAYTVTIPARPFLGWSDRLLGTLGEVLGGHLEQQIAP